MAQKNQNINHTPGTVVLDPGTPRHTCQDHHVGTTSSCWVNCGCRCEACDLANKLRAWTYNRVNRMIDNHGWTAIKFVSPGITTTRDGTGYRSPTSLAGLVDLVDNHIGWSPHERFYASPVDNNARIMRGHDLLNLPIPRIGVRVPPLEHVLDGWATGSPESMRSEVEEETEEVPVSSNGHDDWTKVEVYRVDVEDVIELFQRARKLFRYGYKHGDLGDEWDNDVLRWRNDIDRILEDA